MSNQDELQQAIRRIAAGTYTPQDLELYNNWCNAAQEQDTAMPADWTAKQQQMLQQIEKKIQPKSYRKLIVWSGVAAAAAVLIIFLSGIWATETSNHSKQTPVAFNTLTTTTGQQQHLTLPDGTQVWLNAASSLKYPASFANTSERRVQLTGEAYFEVAKDKQKPFIVHSSGQEVKVLGTHFNISSYEDDPHVQTTLLEGAINVNNVPLHPGEQSLLDHSGKLTTRKTDTALAVAWKKGYLEFRNENIYGIMRKISRFHHIQVIYEGNIPQDGMNGNIALRKSIPEILEIIQTTSLLRCRQEGNKIFISKY